ncbi:tetratricopeptide repeat protein [Achromobacter xylosoxidans]|uniref:tetratricopeptide repeat protein n=1 Tax=Alcaligenes xylosoxydans xylosoxydans TaxID=85698 RepID=UPI00211AA9F7|nr:tetratricopeptide repeat protein [Achromobacter xylosoxidans]
MQVSSDRNPKIDPETEKLELEWKKFRLAEKTWWLDIVSKVGIPLSLLILSGVTFYSGSELSKDKLRFERDVAQSDLLRKDRELFLRSNESLRAAARIKGEFIEKHSALILSNRKQDRILLEQYIVSSFEPDAQTAIRAQVETLRRYTQAVQPEIRDPELQPSVSAAQPLKNYIELGQSAVKGKKFEDAILAFKLHLASNPNDAAVWNYLSYAQMRAGQLKEARESISTAIYQQPTDLKVRQFVALNAAKILCSAGEVDEGVGYLKTATQAIPGLAVVASKDGELRNRCAWGVGP